MDLISTDGSSAAASTAPAMASASAVPPARRRAGGSSGKRRSERRDDEQDNDDGMDNHGMDASKLLPAPFGAALDDALPLPMQPSPCRPSPRSLRPLLSASRLARRSGGTSGAAAMSAALWPLSDISNKTAGAGAQSYFSAAADEDDGGVPRGGSGNKRQRKSDVLPQPSSLQRLHNAATGGSSSSSSSALTGAEGVHKLPPLVLPGGGEVPLPRVSPSLSSVASGSSSACRSSFDEEEDEEIAAELRAACDPSTRLSLHVDEASDDVLAASSSSSSQLSQLHGLSLGSLGSVTSASSAFSFGSAASTSARADTELDTDADESMQMADCSVASSALNCSALDASVSSSMMLGASSLALDESFAGSATAAAGESLLHELQAELGASSASPICDSRIVAAASGDKASTPESSVTTGASTLTVSMAHSLQLREVPAHAHAPTKREQAVTEQLLAQQPSTAAVVAPSAVASAPVPIAVATVAAPMHDAAIPLDVPTTGVAEATAAVADMELTAASVLHPHVMQGEALASGAVAAREYSDEILSHLLEAESRYLANPLYMEQVQHDLSYQMRAILIDWLIEVCEEYALSSQSLFLALNYIDRFLSVYSMDRAKLQLLGVAALLLAGKYWEVRPPSIDDLIYISDATYTREQVLFMEQLLLNTLRFHLMAVTPWDCQTRLGEALGEQLLPPRTQQLAAMLMEVFLLEPHYLHFRPSQIAVSALFLALYTTHQNPWPTELEVSSRLSVDNIQMCVRSMHAAYLRMFHGDAAAGGEIPQAAQAVAQGMPPLVAIKEKYAQERMGGVANIPPRLL